MRGVAGPLHRDLGDGAIDLAQVVGRQLDGGCAEVLLQAMQLGGAGDRNDPGLLRQQPGQGDLRRRRPSSAPRSAPSSSTSAWFALRASGVKRGTMLRKSLLSNVVVSSIAPVRKPLPRGLKATKPMPSSSQRRQDLGFGLTPPQRIFALERGDRLDRMRAADRLRARLGEAEVLHLALLDQLLDRAGDVFDRHVRVDAMLIEQVDAVGPQALERRRRRPAGCAPAGCPRRAARSRRGSRTWSRSRPGRGRAPALRPPAPRSRTGHRPRPCRRR